MKILTQKVQTETVIKGSRFLAEAFPCQSQTQARETIKAQKEKYSDASHVVHAFVVGKAAEVLGTSDDGEPSGTAGRPTLDVLKGSGVTDILVTVTRWFGGTLLGTGGLVKAYGGSAKQVLEEAILKGAVEEYSPKKDFSFLADYSLYKKIRRAIEDYGVSNLKEEFSESVKATGQIEEGRLFPFLEEVKNISNGKVFVQVL